jgi:hypothetical protein
VGSGLYGFPSICVFELLTFYAHMALRSSIAKGSNYYFFGFTSSGFFKARNCYVLRVFFGLVPPIVAGIHTPSNS